jgi:hypothetical protein
MKKLVLPFAAIFVLVIAGCKLDPPDFSNTGNSTNGTSTNRTSKSDNYQPVTKGSYWKFNSTIAGKTETQTHTMTGATATFNNKTYYTINAVSSNSGTSTSYYYHGNDNYTNRSTSGGVTVEYLYLKDNYTVGKTWTAPMTDNGNINSIPAQVIGKIVEMGVTKVISGKTFTDVVHTQVLIQYDLGSGFETVQTQDYYIANGVGIIEADSNASGITSSSVVSDYSIK